ncbi:MAG: HAMP domain-containing histidine kinase [Anaerolineae bacterium]|nr:HAMP domain-containing histidine kinase [Anaerolineae bacterium]
MTQLDIRPQVYEKIIERANQTGQSVEEWLAWMAVGEANPSELNAWFVRLIAHDLRTPLAAIVTSSDILKHYHDRLTDERRVQHLDTIQLQVRMLNNLLDNVMVIQKLEAGLLACEMAIRSLETVCRKAIEDVAMVVYYPPEITFQFQSDSDRPLVVFDERLMLLALLNILMNAIQYSPEGARVDMFLTVDADQAAIQIQDEGIGIPPEEQAAVFELFYRASNAKSVGGKGLGLTVAQRIVRLHNGTLTLDSILGQGTRVVMSLPVSRGDAPLAMR